MYNHCVGNFQFDLVSKACDIMACCVIRCREYDRKAIGLKVSKRPTFAMILLSLSYYCVFARFRPTAAFRLPAGGHAVMNTAMYATRSMNCHYFSQSPSISLGKKFSSTQSSTFITSIAALNPETFANDKSYRSAQIPSILPNRSCKTLAYISMAKGDGKKKRKKKSSTTMETSSSQTGSTARQTIPLRVSNLINVPVRRQIMYAKLNKEVSRLAGAAFRKKRVERTKYRRTWGEYSPWMVFLFSISFLCLAFVPMIISIIIIIIIIIIKYLISLPYTHKKLYELNR